MEEIRTPFIKFTKAFLEWSKNKDAVTISISTFFDFIRDTGLFDEMKIDKYLSDKGGEIKKGDMVKVVNKDWMYRTYIAWVVDHISDKKQLARFQYNNEFLSDVNRYEVIEVDDGIAFIESAYDSSCYLFNVAGLEKVFYGEGES